MTSIGVRFIQSLASEQLLELASQKSSCDLAGRVDDYLDRSLEKEGSPAKFAEWFLQQDGVDELFASDDQLAEHLQAAVVATTRENRASSLPKPPDARSRRVTAKSSRPVGKDSSSIATKQLLDQLAALQPGTTVYDDAQMTTVDIVTTDPTELTVGMSLWWNKIAQRGLDLPVKAWDTIVLSFHDNDAVAMFQKRQKPLGDDVGVRITGFVDPRALEDRGTEALPTGASIETWPTLREKAVSLLSSAAILEPAASGLYQLMSYRPFEVILADRTEDDLSGAQNISVIGSRKG